MPIYEYRCDTCGNVFEEWHRHADDITEQACPECRETAHRLISSTTFVLKGGGWYVTEYGNRKADGGAKTSTQTGHTGAATETKTETKTETTTKSVPPAPSGAPAAKSETAAAS